MRNGTYEECQFRNTLESMVIPKGWKAVIRYESRPVVELHRNSAGELMPIVVEKMAPSYDYTRINPKFDWRTCLVSVAATLGICGLGFVAFNKIWSH